MARCGDHRQNSKRSWRQAGVKKRTVRIVARWCSSLPARMVVLYAFVAPFVAQGQSAAPTLKYATSFARQSLSVVSVFTTVAGAAALLFFFWGLAQFIAKSDEEQARSEGRRRMVWGVIALFVLVSVWGMVMLIGYVTGIGNTKEYQAPVVEGL